MTARVTPPFRADHLGSLLPPQPLLEAREAWHTGESADELRRAEDEAITEVVAMQERVGLDTVTDGEFRRASWHRDFFHRLHGVSEVTDAERKVEGTALEMRVDDRIALTEPIFAEEFTALARRAERATPKLTIPSPGMLYRGGRVAIDETVYPDPARFRADLATAYRAQVTALADRGCHYLQLDDTDLAHLNGPRRGARVDAYGDTPENEHMRTIELINSALADRPDTLTVTAHLCRGHDRPTRATEASDDVIAEALFGELDVDGFFLEFDDAHSSDFAPLRYVPRNKTVVLGLVTTESGELESKDTLKRRVDAASQYIDLDQLCLSPRCGFASTEGNELTIDQQIAKLSLIVETAAEIWG